MEAQLKATHRLTMDFSSPFRLSQFTPKVSKTESKVVKFTNLQTEVSPLKCDLPPLILDEEPSSLLLNDSVDIKPQKFLQTSVSRNFLNRETNSDQCKCVGHSSCQLDQCALMPIDKQKDVVKKLTD